MRRPRPFCIIGTPRSRTAWFAEFLSHGDVRCVHEPSKRWRDDLDMAAFFAAGGWAADSMLTLKWRELRALGVDLIAVLRDPADVLASIRAAGLPQGSPALARLWPTIADLPDDLPRYAFADLDRTCAQIFARCHGYAPSDAWRRYWCRQQVEADFADVLRATDIAALMKFYHLGD